MAELARFAGVKAEDAEYFAADITVPEQLRGERITVYCIQTAVELEYTLDSGSTWHDIKGAALAADTPETFVIYINGTDTLNFRCPNAAGSTVDLLQVIS